MRLLPRRKSRVPVLQLHGLLMAREGALNLASVAPALERAGKAAAGRTLVLDIDSRGGSPVQSDLIAQAIRRAAGRHRFAVVAAIGEVGASGGYWLACAADRIVANEMSIVGSIGVIGGGFGVQELLARNGIERRVYTAGENKARLDPFRAERPEDVAFIEKLLGDIHARFKDWVRARRPGRIDDEAAVFDGSFFLGADARRLGLIDGTGDVDSVVREIGGERARKVMFRTRRRRLSLAGLLGQAALEALRP